MTPAILSPEDLKSQVEAIQLLMAMWGGDDELQMAKEDEEAVQNVVKYLQLPISSLGSPESVKLKESLPNGIKMTLLVDPSRGGELPDEEETESTASASLKRDRRTLMLDVVLPIRAPEGHDFDKATSGPSKRPRLQLKCAPWLSRSEHQQLCEAVGIAVPATKDARQAETDEEEEDAAGEVLSTVERLSEAAVEVIQAQRAAGGNTTSGSASLQGTSAHLSAKVVRIWSWLPSLSTKAKRDELVSYAQLHDPPLTGFVLAGKPGLVVLECPLPDPASNDAPPATAAQLSAAANSISSYWSLIKSRSWADIPSGHKKVTERLVEKDVARAFEDMRDMTASDELGGKEAMRGTYGHRNDMGNVEDWLESRGVGGRLRDVLGADWAQ